MDSSTQKIEAYLVPVDARLGTLPRHFGRRMVVVETAVYEFMRFLAPAYRGGYWHFYELSNSGFYMAPQLSSVRLRIAANEFEGEMSPDAAGITACLFAFSHLSFRFSDDERFARHFHQLREFALGHAEMSKIFKAID